MKKDKLSRLFSRFNPRDLKVASAPMTTILNASCKDDPNGIETVIDPCTVEDTDGFTDPGDRTCDPNSVNYVSIFLQIIMVNFVIYNWVVIKAQCQVFPTFSTKCDFVSIPLDCVDINQKISDWELAQFLENGLMEIGTKYYYRTENVKYKNFDLLSKIDTSRAPVLLSEFISSLHDSTRVIIFNESHYNPIHRYNLMTVLLALYSKGFRELALEGFDKNDTLINHRKYNWYNQGFYTAEPRYSNLINYAIRLGFRVHGFDDFLKGHNRDSLQAVNLVKIVATNPAGKLVVLSGYGHMSECSSYQYMGFHFKKMSGINPLTIDQVYMPQYFSRNNEHLWLKHKFDSHSEPVLFQLTNADSFYASRDCYDVSLFSPTITYTKHRPTQLIHSDLFFKLKYRVKNIPNNEAIVFVTSCTDDNAVPEDIYQYNISCDDKFLILFSTVKTNYISLKLPSKEYRMGRRYRFKRKVN